jgi:succinate dehydrogenase/fumarate reductase flavoprotein subunit
MGGISVGGSSAGMSIHKSEGLVPVNDKGASNIAGLYAAGDALGSHMAGAIYTQIGSSLAGSAVQGTIVSEAAAKYCEGIALPKISKARIKAVGEKILAPLKRKAGYGPAWVTQTLQGIMIPNFVLYNHRFYQTPNRTTLIRPYNRRWLPFTLDFIITIDVNHAKR